jgi:hypothetical protein
LERGAELHTFLYDLRLLHVNERGHDLDPGLGLGAHLDGLVEGLVEGLAAVGIARAVFLHRADEYLRGADDLGPGCCNGEQMGVAEGDVGGGDTRRDEGRRTRDEFRNRNIGVREGRAADALQVFEAHDEPLPGLVEVRDLVEGPEFPLFRPLAVVHMEKCQAVFSIYHGGGDATVHAAAHEHYCKFVFHGRSLPIMLEKCQRFEKKEIPAGRVQLPAGVGGKSG